VAFRQPGVDCRLRKSALAVVAAGVAVAVSAGDGDLATDTPMRGVDRFHIGSITKTFVATVVLQLVAEHRLTLDD
jgi:CubicO group peptidase (beta-lactamase class C family)